MKKFFLFLLIALGAFTLYLKIPLYHSPVEEKYFETQLSQFDVQSEKNLFPVIENYITSLNKVNNESFNAFYKDCKAEEVKELGEYDSQIFTDLTLLLAKQSDTLEALKKGAISQNQEFYMKEEISKHTIFSSLLRFDTLSLCYATKLSHSGKKTEAIKILSQMTQLSSFILSNADISPITSMVFQQELQMALSSVDSFQKKDAMYTKLFFKPTKYEMPENGFTQSMKYEFAYNLENYDAFFNRIGENTIQKVAYFFFFNQKETKELFKDTYKDMIEGNPNPHKDIIFWKNMKK